MATAAAPETEGLGDIDTNSTAFSTNKGPPVVFAGTRHGSATNTLSVFVKLTLESALEIVLWSTSDTMVIDTTATACGNRCEHAGGPRRRSLTRVEEQVAVPLSARDGSGGRGWVGARLWAKRTGGTRNAQGAPLPRTYTGVR